MKNRLQATRLQTRFRSKLGRLLVVTGARQVGKTTLVQHAFPETPYIAVDDPMLRPSYTSLSAAAWIERYPTAIIDEVHKAPSIIDAIKAAHDAADHVRYLLLGSSQILLLERVKESLAGRASIEELWPLSLPEMATASWDEPVGESRLVHFLRSGCQDRPLLLGLPAASRTFARYSALFDRYLEFGGMPAICDPDLDEAERYDWLRNYQRTYLERDVADLATLRDLEPFVIAQKAIAMRAGKPTNFSELARLAKIAPNTARRFLRYLELSYQVVVLQPYFRNLEKRLLKMPKIVFVDPGILRTILNRRGEPTGEEFESAVVAEIYKQVRCASLPADFFHLRTHDGREVDLLIELPQGFVAIEIKRAARVTAADARSLRRLGELLDKPLLASLVVSMDQTVQQLGADVIACPAPWLLAPVE